MFAKGKGPSSSSLSSKEMWRAGARVGRTSDNLSLFRVAKVWILVFALLITSTLGRLNEGNGVTSRDDQHRRSLIFFYLEEEESCRGESNCERKYGILGNKMHGYRRGKCIEECIWTDLRQIWFKEFWDWECGPCDCSVDICP
jgi:hypothetical protein